MTEYINVAVPSELVPEVYRFIADRKSGQALAVDSTGSETLDAQSRNWSRAELQLLAASDAPSVKLFCEVLDVLADVSPASMAIDSIGDHFGVEGLTLQKKFGAVTRWMKGRIKGEVLWPIHFTSESEWYMNDHNARAWKQIRG